MDTPFQWTKQVASHFGGTRNGLVVHWPKGSPIEVASHTMAPRHRRGTDHPGGRRVPHPDRVDGIAQRPSRAPRCCTPCATAPRRTGTSPSTSRSSANRGIFHDGWTAVTKHRSPWDLSRTDPIPFDQDTWELYDITRDFSQATDLASEYPERLAALQELFLEQARLHQVLPLDDRGIERMDAAVAGRRVPTWAGGSPCRPAHGDYRPPHSPAHRTRRFG
ncbi:hypothetical protein GS426_08680 [Rhodococcus hoagii]|nr:hypothetical protein [Prescottella equi]